MSAKLQEFKVGDLIINGQSLIFEITYESQECVYLESVNGDMSGYAFKQDLYKDGYIRKLTKLERALS